MKKLIFIALLPFFCFSQVGIGTVTPQSELHVAGAGTIQADSIPYMVSDRFIVQDTLGKFGWNYGQDGTSFLKNVANHYYWYGGAVNDTIIGGGYYLNSDLDINTQISITVPAGKLYMVDVDYTIPIGIITPSVGAVFNAGIRFYRNGIEEEKSNSGFSFNSINTFPDYYQKGDATSFFKDWIYNNTGSAITITYELRGYIQQHYSNQNETIYSFRYWDKDITQKGQFNVRIYGFVAN